MIFRVVEFLRGFLMPPPFWIKPLGRRGEYIARRYFHRRGYHCLARNWRHGRGEIDVIMANARRVVFIEVKTRTGGAAMRIGDAITHAQKERLRRLARRYLATWTEPAVPWELALVLVTPRGLWRFRVERVPL